ncbi:DUF5615 family PIN-like protein [Candidatus Nitrososphaera sp. FF02]|uniref:DUF5615 family PIN-like protein n=1 Tax=Candidatus Nitrososphaera sp. FF02 TaxID=3398226 RepID=UPI0039E8E57A
MIWRFISRVFRQPQRLLLDECVSSRLVRHECILEIKHSVLAVRCGARDDEVLQHAKATGQTIVTADFDFIRKCISAKVRVAAYYDGNAYFLKKQALHFGQATTARRYQQLVPSLRDNAAIRLARADRVYTVKVSHVTRLGADSGQREYGSFCVIESHRLYERRMP